MTTILEEAEAIVNRSRRNEYGSPADNWRDTVALWNTLLRKKLKEPLTEDDAMLMMIAMKLARLAFGYKRDSHVDIPGYARAWEMIRDARALAALRTTRKRPRKKR